MTCKHPIASGISTPCFYGDVISKAKRFKPDTSELMKSLKSYYKGCDLTTIVES